MNGSQMESLRGLSCEERFDYFLSKVVEDKEIWILINKNNEFLKIYAEDQGFEYLPVWPGADLAQAHIGKSGGLIPKSIPLPEFLRKWIAGLTKDGLDVGVFPGSDFSVWVMNAEELKQDMQDELSNT